MADNLITRRHFAGILGMGIAGSLAGCADAQPSSQGGAASSGGQPGVPRDAATGPLARLDSNENPYGPSEAARAAIRACEDVYNRYPDSAEKLMREAIARHHGVTPDQVILGCGSTEILKMADAAFLGAGRNVVAAEPTFEAVLAYARVVHAEAVTIPLTADYRHDLVRMAAACSDRTGLVYVCNPNNPTGTIVDGAALEAFLHQVPSTATVLVDEAYHHFVEDRRYRSAIEMVGRFPNLMVARTFSKIHGMAGMRLGYAVAPPPLIAALAPQAVASNGNVAVLEAAMASLGDSAHVARQQAVFRETRSALYAELDRDGRRFIPSEANFVMIHIGTDVGPLVRSFSERRIWVGRRFAAMPEWLRVSLGRPEEMRLFVAALRELAPVAAAAA